jgi:release factor glutamine methyltransferase
VSGRSDDQQPLRVADALRLAKEHLKLGGVPEPELDSELLLRHVLGWDRARILANPDELLSSEQQDSYLERIEQRAMRRPLQHLTGVQEFWGREFRVTPDVLIPRPETELIVAEALTRLPGDRATLVDVGTGSGCIAISLGAERPGWRIHALDLSDAALVVARDNARRLGVSNVVFESGDLLEAMDATPGEVDLVASNPPYVASDDFESLAPEVRLHEPTSALTPPGAATSVYARLAPQAHASLRSGGWLLLELGIGLAEPVSRSCESAGLRVETIRADLQGIPRLLVARKP